MYNNFLLMPVFLLKVLVKTLCPRETKFLSGMWDAGHREFEVDEELLPKI